MAEGYLIVNSKNCSEAYPIVGASVRVEDKDGDILYTLTTNESGRTEQITLPTVDKALSLDENYKAHPYSIYTVRVHAPGYTDVIIHGVHIFEGELTIQPVSMIPIPEVTQHEQENQKAEETVEDYGFKPDYSAPIVINIGEHAIESSDERKQVGVTPDNPRQRVLPTVIIPSHITVHLGRPAANAQRVRVPFLEYIKNVASHEIYPTWPENALRANIYAIITFTLNRVFTEWYRGRGYPFDITNSTAFDQAFVYGGTIFGSINRIVDEIFNQYVKRPNQVAPFFTSYCNGTTATCSGLSQWGTVPLAKAGVIKNLTDGKPQKKWRVSTDSIFFRRISKL